MLEPVLKTMAIWKLALNDLSVTGTTKSKRVDAPHVLRLDINWTVDQSKYEGRTKFVLAVQDAATHRAWVTAITCGASAARVRQDLVDLQ